MSCFKTVTQQCRHTNSITQQFGHKQTELHAHVFTAMTVKTLEDFYIMVNLQEEFCVGEEKAKNNQDKLEKYKFGSFAITAVKTILNN